MSIQSAGLLSQPSSAAVETRSSVERVEREQNQHSLPLANLPVPKKVPPEELLETITELTDTGKYQVRFEIDAPTNRFVILVIDAESGEEVRQIPTDEILNTVKFLNDLRGNIVDSQS